MNHITGSDIIFWHLIDGFGLCLITACTILDAIFSFDQYFLTPLLEDMAVVKLRKESLEISHHVFSIEDTAVASSFWLAGRILQILGLFLLILYAATFNYSVELDRAGMLFLTVGPTLNIGACILLWTIDLEPSEVIIHDYRVGEILARPSWFCTEVVEILGILCLDFSMIDGLDELRVLLAEIIGFLILIGSSQFEYFYLPRYLFPIVIIREDMMHLCDTIGLSLLILVSIVHYCSKLNT